MYPSYAHTHSDLHGCCTFLLAERMYIDHDIDLEHFTEVAGDVGEWSGGKDVVSVYVVGDM